MSYELKNLYLQNIDIYIDGLVPYEPESEEEAYELAGAKTNLQLADEELEYAEKYHKLEEQLGCSLEVIEKAIKLGIYNNVPEYIRAVGLIYIDNFYGFMLTCFNENGEQTGCYPTSEYKKTWWLKEDKSE